MVKRVAIAAVILLFGYSLCVGGWGRGRWGFSGSGTASEARVEWADDMVADYEDRHGYLGSTVRDELYDRLASGYLYNTFAATKTECDFLFLLQFNGNLVTAVWAKTGDILRWQMDDSVYVQNNIHSHTKGTGAGILTVSSTDGFSGVTQVNFDSEPVTGIMPQLSLVFTGATTLILDECGFSTIHVDSILGFAGLTSLSINGSGGNPLDCAGEGYKLNQITTLQYIEGAYNNLSACVDSFYTWTDMLHYDWMRMTGDLWGNVNVIENWTAPTWIDFGQDSVWGDGNACSTKVSLTHLSWGNELGGRTVNMRMTALHDLVNLTWENVYGDSVIGDIENCSLHVNLINFNIGTLSTMDRTVRYGDIVVCENWQDAQVIEMERLYGITGDIGAVASCSGLNVCNFHHTDVSGDMAQLSGNDVIAEYQLDSTHVTVSDRFIAPTAYWVYFDSCGFTEVMCDTVLNDLYQLMRDGEFDYNGAALRVRLRGNAVLSALGVRDTTYIDSCCRANGDSAYFYVDAP